MDHKSVCKEDQSEQTSWKNGKEEEEEEKEEEEEEELVMTAPKGFETACAPVSSEYAGT